jgi:hypothetical protein
MSNKSLSVEAVASDKATVKEQRHRATVPDTLDLAEHGRLAINGILGSMNPALDYECVFLTILDTHPAYMLHWSSMVSGVMPKYLEALPLLRQMSGSEQDLDLQQGFVDAMLRNMTDDGLIYDRQDSRRPWNAGVGYGVQNWDEDYANMAGNGRAITGLLYWLKATGDEAWCRHAKRTAERMLELAVTDGDMAFYPNPGLGNDFSYPRKSGWTTRNPPEKANEGFEGASMFYLFQPLRGFARYYAATGDERFKEISRKFVNCGLQPKFWGGAADMSPDAGADVNMWLNRRSPWLDVWSWLPHEGKLLIQNKGMRQLTVRKPGWAHRARIRCQVDGRDVEPRWVG